MPFSQKRELPIRNSTKSFISANDIWKQRVVLDAIRSMRGAKSRVTKFF